MPAPDSSLKKPVDDEESSKLSQDVAGLNIEDEAHVSI
jgi:hypothetical protein